MNEFGNNLKKARKMRKMNQQALGSAIGVGQTTIANYEKGVRFPTGELLKKLAEILNVSIDVLMGHRVIEEVTVESDLEIEALKSHLVEALIGAKEQEAIALIWSLNPDNDNLLYIYEEVLGRVMTTIGDLWEQGTVSVAVEHYASNVVHKMLAMLSTIPAETPKRDKKAVCMSLDSEQHTIGIKMVSEYFSLMGVQSYYIGTDVPLGSLVQMLKNQSADVLAVSVTMSSHLDSFQELLSVIGDDPAFEDLKIIAGGKALDNLSEEKRPDGVACFRELSDVSDWLRDN